MKRGFSLIEALVALGIAAMSMTAILSLQHALVDGQERYEAAIAKADVKKNALAIIREINPDEVPEGESPLPPNLTVRWTSEALYEPKTSAGFPRGDGRFQVSLYKVTVDVIGADGTTLQTFDVERPGWTSGTTTGL